MNRVDKGRFQHPAIAETYSCHIGSVIKPHLEAGEELTGHPRGALVHSIQAVCFKLHPFFTLPVPVLIWQLT